MYKIVIPFLIVTILLSCKKREDQDTHLNFKKPRVSGNQITFDDDSTASYFTSQPIVMNDLLSDFSAPARVVASVIASSEIQGQNLIVFDNPKLTSNYAKLLKFLANVSQIEDVLIKQRTIELERLTDMQKHGVSTGRDVLNAQTALIEARTNLIIQKASLDQQETMLSLGGFNTSMLRSASAGTIWIISEFSDNHVSIVKPGDQCQVVFSSFSGQIFNGKVAEIGSVVNNVTRMMKVRIEIINSDYKLKAGMLGSSYFKLKAGKFLILPPEALVTIQGKHFVFIKKSKRSFECRAVSLGHQANNQMTVLDGVRENEMVVIKGAQQLKGLVFGY